MLRSVKARRFILHRTLHVTLRDARGYGCMSVEDKLLACPLEIQRIWRFVWLIGLSLKLQFGTASAHVNGRKPDILDCPHALFLVFF